MTKSTISKIWIAGLVVFAGGLIVGGISLGLMLANGGTWTPAPSGNGYDFQPNLGGYFWTTLSIMIVGFVVASAGGIVQLAAWVGALANTYRFQDKTWFLVLLVGGLLSFATAVTGFAAMLAYVVAGPDGMALHEQPMRQPMQPPMRPPMQPPMRPPMPQPPQTPTPEPYPRELAPTH